MFYYAQINDNYEVIDVHGLAQTSTNENYIEITEEQYTSGELVGTFYNSLSGTFEIMTDSMGSTDNVQVDNTNMMLSTKIDNMQVEIDGKADVNHTHTGYVSQSDLELLGAVVDTKADETHTHTEYSLTSHIHNGYATTESLDTLSEKVDGKADASHIHSDYVTTTDFDVLEVEVNNKANATDLNSHASDTELHITEAERTMWNAKSDFSGNYNDLTNKPNILSIDGLASEDYVDEKVDAITVESIGALPNTTVIPTVPTNVSAFTNDAGYLTEHQSLDGLATETYVNTQIDAIDIPTTLSDLTADSTHRLVTDTEKATWNAKSDFSGSYNDLTDKPSIPSISGLATETYVDEAVSTKADSGHTHGDIYYTEAEVDSLLSGKANSTHNHNSSYDALGTAETKANAVQANLDVVSGDLAEHIDNVDIHFTTAERTKLSGIAAGAQVNTITGVKGNSESTYRTGNVNITKANIGLGNVDNTADADKSVNYATSAGSATSATKATQDASGNTITATYETKTDATAKLDSAKSYTDTKTANLASATVVDNKISTHNTSTSAHNDIRVLITDLTTKVNNFLDVDDTTKDQLSELIALIQDNAADIESITSGKVNVSDIVNNLTTNSTSKVLSAAQGVAIKTLIDTLQSELDSHTHAIADVSGLQSALDGKAATSHGTHVSYSTTAPVMDGTASVGTASTVARSDHKHPTDTSRAAQTDLDSHTSNKSNPHGVTLAQLGVTATAAELNKMDGVTATTEELNYVDGVTSNIQTQLNNKAASSHTHSAATTSAAGLMSASDKSKLDGIASGANKYTLPTASSTLGGVKTTSTVTSNSGYTACPIISGVPYYKDTNTTYNLGSFGVTATAAELNTLDGITATTAELNYVDGVTSNIQTQLNGKASSSHTHNYAGSSSAGGSATSANKLATARTISLTGDVTGSTSFDGSGNVSIAATVADDSHNHTIANVDNLQTTLNGKASTSHNHDSDYVSKDLQMTADNGDISISWSGKDVVAQFKALASGMHTAYSPAGATNNPNSSEAFRFMCHKTGSANYGWVMAYGGNGSVYTGYVNGGNWQGWKALWEYAPAPLWSGGANGGYYMTATHTITPTKKLSECRNGWLLLWSDYDVGAQANNTDFATTFIPKRAYTGQLWSSAPFYCDVPSYQAGTATDSEQRVIKLLTISDTTITGTANNAAAPRNDVVLRAVYEF